MPARRALRIRRPPSVVGGCREQRAPEPGERAGEDGGVARGGGDDQRSLDADHEILGAGARDGLRPSGLAAEGLDRVEPHAERVAQRTAERQAIRAGAQALEETRNPTSGWRSTRSCDFNA